MANRALEAKFQRSKREKRELAHMELTKSAYLVPKEETPAPYLNKNGEPVTITKILPPKRRKHFVAVAIDGRIVAKSFVNY